MSIWYSRSSQGVGYWKTHDPTQLQIDGYILYAIVYDAALGPPSSAQLKIGNASNNIAAAWSASTALPLISTVFDWPTIASGLSSGDYRVALIASDGVNDTNLVYSGIYNITGASIRQLVLVNGLLVEKILTPVDMGIYLLNGALQASLSAISTARRVKLDVAGGLEAGAPLA